MMLKQAGPVSKVLPELTVQQLRNMAIAAGLMAGPGAYFGKHVTPRIFHYKGDPAAENLSTLIDASMFAALGAAAMRPGLLPKLLSRPLAIPGIATGVATSELLPMGLAAMRQASGKKTTYDKLRDALGSPTARGAGAGAGAAALAGLGTGMLRAPSERERTEGTPRSEMAIRDVLKFLLPAMIAGGVGGRLIGQQPPRPAEIAPIVVAPGKA